MSNEISTMYYSIFLFVNVFNLCYFDDGDDNFGLEKVTPSFVFMLKFRI